MSKNYDFLQKVVVIGDAGTGKSSLLTRFADDTFSESYVSTIGVDFRIRTVEQDGKSVKLQLWDTAGQERFRTITTSYYRGAQAVYVVFDLTDRQSFGNVEQWCEEISRYTDDVPIVVLGNKSDQTDQLSVTSDEAKALASKLGVDYFEVSAKSGANVEAAFRSTALKVLQKHLATYSQQPAALENCSDNFSSTKSFKHDSHTISDADVDFEKLEPVKLTNGTFLPPKIPNVPGELLAQAARMMLPAARLQTIVSGWLEEECPLLDVATSIVGDTQASATISINSHGVVLAGVPFVNEIFKQLECEVHWYLTEGEQVKAPPTNVARVSGTASMLLQGEVIALNCLARTCGVASTARRLMEIAKSSDWKGRVACTQRTTPGFRLVEKYSALIGGMDTHCLSDMVMINSNHLYSLSDVKGAVLGVRALAGFSKRVAVDCDSEDMVLQAVQGGADVIMIKNTDAKSVNSIGQNVKKQFPAVLIEASGGMTEENMQEYMLPNIDIISTPQAIQNSQAVDLNFKFNDGSRPCLS